MRIVFCKYHSEYITLKYMAESYYREKSATQEKNTSTETTKMGNYDRMGLTELIKDNRNGSSCTPTFMELLLG